MILSANEDLARARTFLFVPANRPERFAKAMGSGADAVVLDLEDSVPPDAKDAARLAILSASPGFKQAACSVVVRINSPESASGRLDVDVLKGLQGLAGIMVPKCESGEALDAVRRVMPTCWLLPLIESAAGYLALADIARRPHVCRLVVGHIDFLADTGMTCSDDQRELDSLRFQVAMHTRQAQLAPAVDGVTVSVDDSALIRADTERSIRFGLGGKLCIHPRQIPVVHAALAPPRWQVEWAHRVVAAMQASAGAAVQLDGRMIDLPVVLQARRVLSRCG